MRCSQPPAPIGAVELLPENLPEAWSGGEATALGLYSALSQRAGKPLPWQGIRESLDAAYRIRLLERDSDSGAWPCALGDAPHVRLRLPKDGLGPPPDPPVPSGLLVAEAYVAPHEIQDLAERIGDITKVAVGHDLKFHLRIEIGGDARPPDDVVSQLNQALAEMSEDLALPG